MTENRYSTGEKSDELDLIALLEKIVLFFKRYSLILIIFSILGLGLGILMYSLQSKQYESKLLLHTTLLTNPEQIQIIDAWQDLLRKKEYGLLAAQFNIHPDTIQKVNKISAEEIQKLYVQDNPNGFVVEVLVKDTSVLDELQKGIVYGLRNNEYVREKIAVRKANLNELIQKTENEMIMLDSTKRSVEAIINNKSSNNSSVIIDIGDITTQVVDLREKLLTYKENLRFIEGVQVLQPFYKYSNPEHPKMPKFLFYGLVFGIFIGYIMALLKHIQRRLKQREYVRTHPV